MNMKNDVNKLIEALAQGNRIRPKSGTLKISTSIPVVKVTYKNKESKYLDLDENYFFNKFEIPKGEEVTNVHVVGLGSYKLYQVDYIYFNPQCNRCLVKLTDGNVTDYPLNLTTFLYNEFEIVPKNKPKRQVTLSEVYAMFGGEVEIVR
jgi:hypothetical protein